jgi:hypothetical protein
MADTARRGIRVTPVSPGRPGHFQGGAWVVGVAVLRVVALWEVASIPKLTTLELLYVFRQPTRHSEFVL